MNAITLKWEGIDLHANRDAWFNATEIAEAHGKEVYDWLRLKRSVTLPLSGDWKQTKRRS